MLEEQRAGTQFGNCYRASSTSGRGRKTNSKGLRKDSNESAKTEKQDEQTGTANSKNSRFASFELDNKAPKRLNRFSDHAKQKSMGRIQKTRTRVQTAVTVHCSTGQPESHMQENRRIGSRPTMLFTGTI